MIKAISFILFWYGNLIHICFSTFQAAYVYTPEVYPTVLRSVGVGSCSGMARLGAALTPYIAQVLMKSSLKLAVGVYVTVALIAAFSCLMLPFETRGHELSDHRNQSSSAKSWHILFKSKLFTKIPNFGYWILLYLYGWLECSSFIHPILVPCFNCDNYQLPSEK